MKYDLLLRGGVVQDPVNHKSGNYDVGIQGGKVYDVAGSLASSEARTIIDVTGYTIMPGVIDTHVHATGPAPKMMALSGVCTALDMGDIHGVMETWHERDAGLNIAGLQIVGPPWPDGEPDASQIDGFVDEVMADGAVGIKILGAYRPATLEATALMIERANAHKVYVAIHVGTVKNGSDYPGLIEAIELAGENSLHIAHVNSYLRGLYKSAPEEAMDGLMALKGKKNLVSESYLALINGTNAVIENGIPQASVCRNCLKLGGYPATEKGLEQAIRDGYGRVWKGEEGGVATLATGEEGISIWRARNTQTGISFPANEPRSTILLAVTKDETGKFIVDAIGTDGGHLPRNVQVESGLALVKYGALTMNDFILKVSTAGASMLGLPGKGHLGVGADADITVLDMERGKAEMTVVGGEVVMSHGVVYGHNGCIITTERGKDAVKARGIRYQVVAPENALLYTKRNQ